MPRLENEYFSLYGGLNYETFRRHFENQAKGESNIRLIKDMNSLKGDSRFRRPSVNGKLILVDLAGEKASGGGGKSDHPPIKVVDENSAVTKRAVDRVAAEKIKPATTACAGNKKAKPRSKSQSNTNNRGERTGAGKRKSGGDRAKKAIKKARDIFEER